MSNFANKVLGAMERIAPRRFADLKWDNVGLLVDCVNPLDHTQSLVGLSLDLTSSVVEECIAKNIGVLVCYHPVIFPSVTSLRANNPKQRALLLAIRNGIGIISPHTCLDNCPDGINSWIAKGVYKHCCTDATMRYDDDIADIHHPDPMFWLTYLDKENAQGAKLLSRVKINLREVIEAMKKHFNVQHIRCSLGVGCSFSRDIFTIGICAGSGASVLRASAGSIDCVITGEMGHHDILHFQQSGTTVLLVEHGPSERGFLNEVLRPRLIEELCKTIKEIQVLTLEQDSTLLTYE